MYLLKFLIILEQISDGRSINYAKAVSLPYWLMFCVLTRAIFLYICIQQPTAYANDNFYQVFVMYLAWYANHRGHRGYCESLLIRFLFVACTYHRRRFGRPKIIVCMPILCINPWFWALSITFRFSASGTVVSAGVGCQLVQALEGSFNTIEIDQSHKTPVLEAMAFTERCSLVWFMKIRVVVSSLA